jgi:hypothetical protein
MELEDLKSIWQKQNAGFPKKGEAEIALMLNGNSKSIIQKLKRSVLIEMIFTLIAGLALLVYALTLPAGALKWASISILIIFVAYTVYYLKKLRLLNSFDASSNKTVRANLEALVTKLSSYLRYYRLSYTILYPVYFFLGIIFGGLGRGKEHFVDVLSNPKTILYLAGIALLFYFSSTWLVKWLLKKLYGNHLEKLKKLLVDIHD